jgi:dTDP-4-amino-4,6-dideoxygalactose transaminase
MQGLADLPLRLPYQHPLGYSSFHLFPIQLMSEHITRAELFDVLRAQGIGVNVHYIPVHTQPYYRQFGFKVGDFPHAEAYYQRAISLPLHQGLTDAEQDYVMDCLTKRL